MRSPTFVVIPLLALGLTAAHAVGLPDTGQTLCDDGANVLVTCSSANTGDAATYPRQDGRFGHDAKATVGISGKIGAGSAGFDYTKVANNGSDLAAAAALGTTPGEWACTRDNITGLTWEVKVNNASHLRHMSWTYTWLDRDDTTNGGEKGTANDGACISGGRCDTEKFATDVNAAALCGYTDWRVPSQRELLTLVHRGAQNPSIDATYFPNTAASSFWSSSTNVADPSRAWVVFFSDGATGVGRKIDQGGDVRNLLRLVRGAPF